VEQKEYIMTQTIEQRPPFPPFDHVTATQKVRAAEDAWNTRDPERVSLAYSRESRWRNRSEFITGREAIVEFLHRKWTRELEYRLIKELWAYEGNRIAVRFAYECHDAAANWFRCYGNENWEFDNNGLMIARPSTRTNACSIGLLGVALMITPASVTLAFRLGCQRLTMAWHTAEDSGGWLPAHTAP
jgi:nuclear transport factor 2 (NTF2) superfamily protein